ncbi:DNA polymerase delta subunit 3 [Armadillidium nasatum]|uniref:DNA polymerase delta subunit 3 n=1 Tax=Armadillidium nasatum TaxID=96803 RepID=A0A5N5SJH6_9CRUS|nr:DNA polymerase delta subunit 3 [Armadillidium nasatum]
MDLQYLDNLDIFINDENKIVTYRWLSLTLSVSSNIAKQMLYHYLQKSKDSDKECKLSVTYLLSGLQFDEELKQDVHKVCVVREDDLEKVKSTFKTIYSLHIYSLQKVQIKDLNILYGIDYDNIKEDVFQSAQYSSISPSSKFRSNVQTKQEIPATSPKKEIFNTNIVTSKIDANDGIIHNKENKFKENSVFQKSTSKKGKGALQSMFANQVKRQETKKPLEVKQESNIKSNSKSVSDGVKKKGSLDAFVSKGPKIKTEEIRRSPRKLSQDKEDVIKKEIRRSPRKLSQDKEDGMKKEIDSVNSDINGTEVEKKIQLSPKREENKKTTKFVKKSPERKCKRKSTSTDMKSIKRQRIMTLADSSSESSAEEEEEAFNESPMPSPPRKTLESDDDDDESPFPPTPKPEETSEKKTELQKKNMN